MSGVLALLASSSSAGFSVSANDVTRVDSGFSGSGVVTTTQSPNIIVSGGAGPFTYLWSRQSGSDLFDPVSPTNANPVWTGTITDGADAVAVWRVTVTDSNGSTSFTDITVTLIWTNLS